MAKPKRKGPSEDSYQTLVEMSPGAVLVTDGDRILFANDAAVRLFGFESLDELLATPVPLYSAADDARSDRQIVADDLASGTDDKPVDRVLRRADGTTFPAVVSRRVIEFGGGQALQVLVRDVSEREAQAEALRQAEERYRTLVEHSADGVVVYDREMNVVFANPAALRLFGARSPDEVVGRPVVGFIAPESRELVASRVRDASTTGAAQPPVREMLLDANGTAFPAEVSSMPISYEGRPAILATVRDLSSRESAQRAIEENEDFLRRVLDTTSELVYIYDLVENRNVYANREILDYLGYTPQQVLDMGASLFQRILHPDDALTVADHHAAMTTSADGEMRDAEYRMRNSNGEWRWLHSRDVPFARGETGLVTQILGSAEDTTERRLAIDALQESVALQNAIFRAMPDGFSLLDADGVHVSVNPALCAMTGFSESELLGVGPPHPYWPPEEYEAIGRGFESTMRGEANEYDLVFMRKNGERFPVSLTAAVIRDAGGTPRSAFSIVRDMTERKQAVEALALETQRLQAHLDNSPVATIEFDPAGRVTFWSEAARRVFGWTADEVVGLNVIGDFPWVHEDDIEAVAKLARDMSSGEKVASIGENRNYRKDGSLIDCTWYNSVLLDSAGAVESLMSQVLDVTERVRMEEALRESEERYRSVVAVLREGIMLQAADGRLLTFNDAAARIFHIEPANAIGQTSVSRDWGTVRLDGTDLPGEDHPSMITFRTGKPVTDMLVGVKGPDDVRWIEVNTEPMIGPGEEHPYAVVVSCADVTERRRVAEELESYKTDLERVVDERTHELTETNKALEEASRAKSQFLASMSHELRTPLNSIIGFTGIMLQGLTGELTSEQRAQLGMVNRAGRQLLGLVSDVLDLERVESGRIELDLEDVDVRKLATGLADTVRPMAEDVGLTVELDLDRSPATVHTDRSKLEQILLNFLSNSVKYTETGSIALIAEGRDDGSTAFTVRDTGIGIAAEDQESIFEEFRQLPAHRGAKHPGSGLGLAISVQLAEVIGGHIELESALGKGSTFTLVLPPS